MDAHRTPDADPPTIGQAWTRERLAGLWEEATGTSAADSPLGAAIVAEAIEHAEGQRENPDTASVAEAVAEGIEQIITDCREFIRAIEREERNQ